jgi:Na+/proline symporter
MIVPFAMLAAFYAIVIAILYKTQLATKPDFNEYAVGGRSYGPWFVAMSYVNSWWPGATFIAFFGLAAGIGVFGFYGLAYSTLGVGLMYFLATRAWRWGAKYNLRSQPELLGKRYNSRWVKVIASLIGIVSVFPWVVLGMQALGQLFEVASGGAWSITVCLAVGLGTILLRQVWTVKMGMRGLIMTDLFQGIIAYVVAGAVCVLMLAGIGNSPISFADIASVPDKFLQMPGDGDGYGPFYLFSLIFTGVIGSLCWPMSFQRIYTASGVRTVKAATIRTMLLSGSFYTLLMLVGIAAVNNEAVMAAPQLGWFSLLEQYGGTWMLGLAVTIVFAASMGHIDGSVQVCGLQIANDIVKRPSNMLTDAQLTKVAKVSMVVFMLLAGVVAFFTFNMDRLQLLAQMSYQGIIQLAVPIFFGIFWKGGNKYGVIAGMLSGFSLALLLTVVFPDDIPVLGSITGGVVGLAVNVVVFLVVSAATGRSAEDRIRVDDFFDVAMNPVSRVQASHAVNAPTEAETAALQTSESRND